MQCTSRAKRVDRITSAVHCTVAVAAVAPARGVPVCLPSRHHTTPLALALGLKSEGRRTPCLAHASEHENATSLLDNHKADCLLSILLIAAYKLHERADICGRTYHFFN